MVKGRQRQRQGAPSCFRGVGWEGGLNFPVPLSSVLSFFLSCFLDDTAGKAVDGGLWPAVEVGGLLVVVVVVGRRTQIPL
ncbi:hypothetical protein BZA05DRAFT_392209 [Tricharina praecox]|uniref:uncharacterized protein n=1 Tax=Tricharina praecox TaxID=43433 RepID=UPI00222086F4|nr:uncharacterized protein BZA05DRAFT_392209 [Tricharina praecox]KAI5854672.1 hypothetical protein BZA05DRAFT_392209 [Tricharina praecox]